MLGEGVGSQHGAFKPRKAWPPSRQGHAATNSMILSHLLCQRIAVVLQAQRGVVSSSQRQERPVAAPALCTA